MTADLEARLVAVDLATGRIRRYVSTEPEPRSIETVGGMAVVSHSEHGAITLVRSATLSVVRVLRGFGEPRYTAGHPAGRLAYVTDSERGEVVVLDVIRGRILGRVRVGAGARHLTLGPAGRRLWVALGTKAQRIAVVDVARPVRPRLLGLLRPPFLCTRRGVDAGRRASLGQFRRPAGARRLQRAHRQGPEDGLG